MSSEVLDKMLQLITAAFGLVAALAWNDAIQTLFGAVFGTQGNLAAKFFYAVVVTVVMVIATVRLGRLAERVRKGEEEESTSP